MAQRLAHLDVCDAISAEKGLCLVPAPKRMVGKWLELSPRGLKSMVAKNLFFMKFFRVFNGFGGFGKAKK